MTTNPQRPKSAWLALAQILGFMVFLPAAIALALRVMLHL